MKKTSLRNNLPLIVLLGLITLAIGLSAFLQASTNQLKFEPYDSRSTTAMGTRALHDWTQALGYTPIRSSTDLARLSDDPDVLFLLPAQRTLTRAETQRVLEWTAAGNTLVVGVDRNPTSFTPNSRSGDALLDELEIVLAAGLVFDEQKLAQPLLADGDIPEQSGAPYLSLSSKRDDIVRVLAANDKSMLLAAEHGAGIVFVSSMPQMFTNSGLRQDDERGRANAGLVRGMLLRAASGATVVFDESRQNTLIDRNDSFVRRLYTTPWGLGMAYGLLLLLGVLALNGRRFGRPQPLPQEIVRRSPAEYVESMARLFRRGNKRQAMLDHYRHQIKLRLGRPAGVDVTLDDAAFVEELRRVRDDIDAPALLNALRALAQASQTTVSESELVRRVSDAQKLIKPETSP